MLTTELLCHYIEFGKKYSEYTFHCKMRKAQFSQQDVSWMVLNLVLHEAKMTFAKFQWSINFCIFFLSYLSWVSADWKNKCWFRTHNQWCGYDSKFFFVPLLSFLGLSLATTYRFEITPLSWVDVSRFSNRLVII